MKYAHDAHEPITPVRTLAITLVTLIILTLATITFAFMNLGPLNDLVALGIALTKAGLIVMIFMGVRFSDSITRLFVIIGWLWVLMLIAGILADVLTRGWLLFQP